MIKNPYINPKFRENVERHIFSNLLIRNSVSPLILGIFGPTGEGKTFQLNEICKALDIRQFLISPGELESDRAGHPAELLRKVYRDAGLPNAGEIDIKPSVIIINDFDTVLGKWGALVQYTVNYQLVYGQMMAFCDFPTEVSGRTAKRIPIIITGNDPSIMYAPLLRPGRMRLQKWVPTLQDKIPIVCQIFDGIPEIQIETLLNKHPQKPVSFWSDVCARYWEQELSKWIQQKGREALLNDLRMRREYDTPQKTISIGTIESIAEELAKENTTDESYLAVKNASQEN